MEVEMVKTLEAIIHPDGLRIARLKRRLRQRDLASDLGVAPQRLSDFEQGLRHPTPEQASILVERLGAEILAVQPRQQQ